MKQRNPIAVALLPFVTFGIYSIYWSVKTKEEMNNLGAKIPTAWLIIVPLANIWWHWKYSEGVAQVTNNKMDGIIAFILIVLLGPIGEAIVQDSFNHVGSDNSRPSSEAPQSPAPTTTTAPPPPAAPVAPVQ